MLVQHFARVPMRFEKKEESGGELYVAVHLYISGITVFSLLSVTKDHIAMRSRFIVMKSATYSSKAR